MAFDNAGWVAFAHGAGETKVFHYRTDDLLTTVDDSGYFNAVAAQLHKGDMILVSGDLDGTPLAAVGIVTSADAATPVTTVWFEDNVTLTLAQPITITREVLAIGTAKTRHVWPAVPSGFVGTVTRVGGVLDTAGAGSGGTSTLTISVPTTGAIATLPFLQDTAAGALIEDTTITAHAALTSTGVITIESDGTGSHTGAALVTIEVTLAPA